MAAGYLPPPTEDAEAVGPCAPDCHTWTLTHRPEHLIAEGESHPDCAETRRMAAETCRFCEKPIGFDVPFFLDPADPANKKIVHAICLETRS